MSELLPCPICENGTKIYRCDTPHVCCHLKGNTQYAHCENCGLMIASDTYEGAIASWNIVATIIDNLRIENSIFKDALKEYAQKESWIMYGNFEWVGPGNGPYLAKETLRKIKKLHK